MEEKKKILVVEDDAAIMMGLEENLKFAGFEVIKAADGGEALKMGLSLRPDLILLDIMLPGMSGYEVCRKLRDAGKRMPVIMLTARDEEFDKLHGFEMGADDYVTKPFSIKELIARIKAVLARGVTREDGVSEYRFGDCVLDVGARVLRKRSEVRSQKSVGKGKDLAHPPSPKAMADHGSSSGKRLVGSKPIRPAQGRQSARSTGSGQAVSNQDSGLRSHPSSFEPGFIPHPSDSDSSLQVSGLIPHPSEVWDEITLTHTEFDLLLYFCMNAGKALSRDQVMNDVWGTEYYGTQRSLDSFVASLRSKIEKKSDNPEHILTVHGVGYKFVM